MEQSLPNNSSAGQAKRGIAGKGALLFIFLTVLLDILGATILFPVLAFIVREYSSDALTVGLMTIIYSAAQFLAAPVLGLLSDRYGRRPVLLISVFGSAIGYFMFGIGGALWILFLSRLIDGITGGNLSVAQAYIADITPPEERAKNFALFGAAFGLGFILGPALGGALSQISLAAPAYAAGVFSLLSVLLGYCMLPESLPKERRTVGAFRWPEANPFAAIRDIIRLPGIGILLLAMVAFNIAFAGMTSNISVFAINAFGMQTTDLAILFTIVGVVNVVVQGGLVRQLAPKVGEKRLALIGLALLILSYLGIAFAPALWMLYPLTAISSIGNALTLPTLAALAANSVSSNNQGKLAGVSASLGSLTSIAGPLWAGASYDYLMHTAPYWSGALILALAWLLLARTRPVAVAE